MRVIAPSPIRLPVLQEVLQSLLDGLSLVQGLGLPRDGGCRGRGGSGGGFGHDRCWSLGFWKEDFQMDVGLRY